MGRRSGGGGGMGRLIGGGWPWAPVTERGLTRGRWRVFWFGVWEGGKGRRESRKVWSAGTAWDVYKGQCGCPGGAGTECREAEHAAGTYSGRSGMGGVCRCAVDVE